jgi:hypothetical protein
MFGSVRLRYVRLSCFTFPFLLFRYRPFSALTFLKMNVYEYHHNPSIPTNTPPPSIITIPQSLQTPPPILLNYLISSVFPFLPSIMSSRKPTSLVALHSQGQTVNDHSCFNACHKRISSWTATHYSKGVPFKVNYFSRILDELTRKAEPIRTSSVRINRVLLWLLRHY